MSSSGFFFRHLPKTSSVFVEQFNFDATCEKIILDFFCFCTFYINHFSNKQKFEMIIVEKFDGLDTCAVISKGSLLIDIGDKEVPLIRIARRNKPRTKI
jgi:hypothetical protein